MSLLSTKPSSRPLADRPVFRLIAWLPILLLVGHLVLIHLAAYTFEPATVEMIGIGLIVAGGVLNMLIFRRFRSRGESPVGTERSAGQSMHFLERFIHTVALLGLFLAQQQMLGLPSVV